MLINKYLYDYEIKGLGIVKFLKYFILFNDYVYYLFIIVGNLIFFCSIIFVILI